MYYFIDNAEDIQKYVIDALCLNFMPYTTIKDIQFLDENKKVIKKIDDTYDVPNGGQFLQKFWFE